MCVCVSCRKEFSRVWHPGGSFWRSVRTSSHRSEQIHQLTWSFTKMPTGLLPDDPGNWRGLREIFIEERQDLHPTRKRRPVWRGARSAPGGSWMFQPLTDEPLSGRPIQSIRFKTGRQDGSAFSGCSVKQLRAELLRPTCCRSPLRRGPAPEFSGWDMSGHGTDVCLDAI